MLRFTSIASFQSTSQISVVTLAAHPVSRTRTHRSFLLQSKYRSDSAPAAPSNMKKYFVLILMFCATSFADQVVLTNGDRLTGVIRKYDEQKLYLKPDYSDEIAIK